MKHKGIYIPSIDAKDIYLSTNYIEKNTDGYNLKLKDGQYNLRKFINSLDFSLDLIELLDIYYIDNILLLANVKTKTFNIPKFINSSAPPGPSSAGWNINTILSFKFSLL